MSALEYAISIKYLGGLEVNNPLYLAEIPSFGNLAQVHDNSRDNALDVAKAAIETLITAYQDQGLELPSIASE